MPILGTLIDKYLLTYRARAARTEFCLSFPTCRFLLCLRLFAILLFKLQSASIYFIRHFFALRALSSSMAFRARKDRIFVAINFSSSFSYSMSLLRWSSTSSTHSSSSSSDLLFFAFTTSFQSLGHFLYPLSVCTRGFCKISSKSSSKQFLRKSCVFPRDGCARAIPTVLVV